MDVQSFLESLDDHFSWILSFIPREQPCLHSHSLHTFHIFDPNFMVYYLGRPVSDRHNFIVHKLVIGEISPKQLQNLENFYRLRFSLHAPLLVD